MTLFSSMSFPSMLALMLTCCGVFIYQIIKDRHTNKPYIPLMYIGIVICIINTFISYVKNHPELIKLNDILIYIIFFNFVLLVVGLTVSLNKKNKQTYDTAEKVKTNQYFKYFIIATAAIAFLMIFSVLKHEGIILN